MAAHPAVVIANQIIHKSGTGFMRSRFGGFEGEVSILGRFVICPNVTKSQAHEAAQEIKSHGITVRSFRYLAEECMGYIEVEK